MAPDGISVYVCVYVYVYVDLYVHAYAYAYIYIYIYCIHRYTLNKTTLKTRIKLPDWGKTTHNCRVMGSVWVLYLLSTHTRPIYPTHFAGSP